MAVIFPWQLAHLGEMPPVEQGQKKEIVVSSEMAAVMETLTPRERSILERRMPGLAKAQRSKTGRYEEAINSLDKAAELDPKFVSAWKVKGDALKALGRNSEAEAAFAIGNRRFICIKRFQDL